MTDKDPKEDPKDIEEYQSRIEILDSILDSGEQGFNLMKEVITEAFQNFCLALKSGSLTLPRVPIFTTKRSLDYSGSNAVFEISVGLLWAPEGTDKGKCVLRSTSIPDEVLKSLELTFSGTFENIIAEINDSNKRDILREIGEAFRSHLSTDLENWQKGVFTLGSRVDFRGSSNGSLKITRLPPDVEKQSYQNTIAEQKLKSWLERNGRGAET